jgi:hypothetical protein
LLLFSSLSTLYSLSITLYSPPVFSLSSLIVSHRLPSSPSPVQHHHRRPSSK